ncbi:MAG: CinA family nicotinamide mononucleotide deamidase-related protein [Bacteroidetes bacterium]|nr:CinA family nicotinamide mononucleotide deamidase-related protein [Bacteroidota bacterium]MDA0903246.1 CinA family nicotinamide mononucleotide deamidase-related protein [Bacteroidota bacterium]MDA1242195.1 CinA family nicotinamide mononucleotide deamidase-related protein [Bacteroidota bacterium]
MNVILVSIGDELLLGQTVNTNAAWMGKRLTEDGWRVTRVECIPDTQEAIISTLDRVLLEAHAVILTGGLGPTKDDITKNVLASYVGSPLVMHDDIALSIEQWFKSRNVPFLEVNRLQAMLPQDCQVLPNRLGTASGMWFDMPHGKVIVSLPGVPYEMEALMDEEVLPKLRSHFKLPTTLYQTMVTAGIGESSLAAILESWERRLEEGGLSLAYLPSPGQVKVRIGVQGRSEDREALKGVMAKHVQEFLELAGHHVIGMGDVGLPEVVLEALSSRGQTLSTAESCTGGTIAAMLTAIPGASHSMWGGVVAYDNKVKREVLSVHEATLMSQGAVSREVVEAMALGAQHRLGTDWAVATSGVAGPTGGSPEKPVGMVWMAVAGPDGVRAWCHHLGRVRSLIVERAARRALTHLLLAIQEGGVQGLED